MTKENMKKLVELADSIEDLAVIICGHGWYDYPNDDREHPVPRKAIEQYLTMGAMFQERKQKQDIVTPLKPLSEVLNGYVPDEIDKEAVAMWNRGEKMDAVRHIRMAKMLSLKQSYELLQSLTMEDGL